MSRFDYNRVGLRLFLGLFGSFLLALGLGALLSGCGGGGGSGPPPTQWLDSSIATSEGAILVRTAGPPSGALVEAVQRRVTETWRDCRRLEGQVVELCEIFRPADVLVWNDPSRGDRYAGLARVQGRLRHVVLVGRAGPVSSLNHEVGDHAACHFDREGGPGLVPPHVNCATVGHPGHVRLDGTPVPQRLWRRVLGLLDAE